MEDNGVADYSNPRVREMAFFSNLPETAVSDARFNHTPGGEYSAYLNWISGMGNENKSVGPATALKVSKGDVIIPEAWVRYKKETENYSRNLTLAALSQFLGTTFAFKPGFEGMNATQVASSFNGALTAASWGSVDPEIDAPYAYLNYVLFDRNTGFIDAGWRRVPESAGFDAGQEGLPGLHQKVAFEEPIVVPENGYIYIWLSNESENTHVWFDDLKVNREGADVVQATDYGAWGDVIREQKTEPTDMYRWYYQGQYAERDLETGWSHFELREYDLIVGRWTVTDPKRQFYSPYVGMGNNPIKGIDPDGGGVLDIIFQNKNGQELGRIVNDQPDQIVKLDTDMTVEKPLVINAANFVGDNGIQALGFGIELSATFGGGMSGGWEFVYYMAGKNKDQLFMYDKFGGNLGFEGSAGVYGFAAWSSDKANNITSDSWLGIFNSYSGGYGAVSGGYFWGTASGKAQLWPGQNGEKPYWQGVSVMGAYSFGAKAGAKWSFQKYTYVENLSLFNVNVTHGRVTFGK